MKILLLYQCEICGLESKDEDRIIECEAQGREVPSVEVGDIIFLDAGWGWFNGDAAWIANPNVKLKVNGAKCPNGYGNCFGECCNYKFYYVVTFIDQDDRPGSHRVRYHIFTKAIVSESDPTNFRHGYTFDLGHCAPKSITRPPKSIINSSKDLIGMKVSNLL